MEGGLDYITLKCLDIDGIRIIGSVLGQSIALDHYVRQVLMHHKPLKSFGHLFSTNFRMMSCSSKLGKFISRLSEESMV